jgi:HSP20 family protein
MAKEKRSFFDRLTGINGDDTEQELDIPTNHDTTTGSEKRKNGWIEEENGEGQLTVDVYQTSDSIVINAMVAGVKPDDLDIAITRDMVTIKGRREASEDVSNENYFFKELYWGAFSRTILLPQEIEVEDAEANERYGMLTITLPKIDKGRQTKLKVKST